MKKIILLIFMLNMMVSYGQDTINITKNYDGSSSYWLITKKDTSIVTTYPNNTIKSVKKYSIFQVSCQYKQFYENGKLLCEKHLENDIEEGKATYYDKKGIKVAELNYKHGKVTDTIYIRKDTHIIFGKITYTSKVYGGMQRPDGGSNISESSGAYQNCKMYAVLLDSLKKPKLIEYFTTDFNGQFMVIVPKGSIGIFPATTLLKDLAPRKYYPITSNQMSGHSGWNIEKPIEITTQKIVNVSYNHYSVGYAP